jgi:hypothetical protein
MASCTWPFPLPLLPPVIVTQGALLDADHGQPAALVTCTALVPPDAGTGRLEGSVDTAQPDP